MSRSETFRAGVVAIQFGPPMAMACVVSAHGFRKTGLGQVGSLVRTLLVPWIVAASRAIHHG
ncbi:MAG TPA: hypothetical protein VLA36_02760 [Longimicrobiales bacterium]|nr:hypothetical protein [Longimicrobiales bacterium]